MRRHLRTILIFLLLGAIVNIAVAWACAWREYDILQVIGGSNGRAYSDVRAVAWWRRNAPERRSETPDEVMSYTVHLGLSLELGAIFPSQDGRPPTDPGLNVMVMRAGWPMRSVSAWMAGQRFSKLAPTAHSAIDRTNLSVDQSPRWLPLMPLVPGFVVNTGFYSALFWLLIPGPFALRRFIRLRRGRCIHCGYDLRGTPAGPPEGTKCPECGATTATT